MHRVRSTIGRGVGYGVRGTLVIAGPLASPMVHAGEDIVNEARRTASGDGGTS